MMNTDDWLNRLQANHQAVLSSVRDQLLKDAQQLITLALSDPNWSGPDAPLDAYMYQANALALAAANCGMLSTAAEVYNVLIHQMQSRFDGGGERRSIGLLLVNLGIIYCTQGNIDAGIFYILEAAKDDSIISGNPPDDSYALTHLFRSTVVDPILANILEATTIIDPNLTQSDIDTWFVSLGHRRYALLAYMVVLVNNRRLFHQHPHEYNYWQIYSCLRNLSALFEVEMKHLARERSLYRALKTLFNSKFWWSTFEYENDVLSAIPDSGDRLKRAFAMTCITRDDHFRKSLLITYIARNYTVHEMDAPNGLTLPELDQVLENLLHAMITAQSFARSNP